ncbi:MAG TPA: WecB/TagA/CpsF family glycosyltransferase, partial [Dehalococcoidia bacterium]
IYAPPHGSLSGEEDTKIRALISAAAPDFLFVAFGCPKQDFWIREHLDLGVPVSVGVGGSFDLLSGAIKRAPAWAQRNGLEWAFRLYHQPRRLAKRYLVDDVQVVGKLLLSRFSDTHEAVQAGDGG